MQYLLFIFFTNVFAREWIDPHDMNEMYSTDIILQKLHLPKNPISQCTCSNPMVDVNLTYLKRIVGLLISSTTLDGDNILRGKYYFDKETANYQFLKDFLTRKEIDIQELRQLDNILTTAFNKDFSGYVVDVIGRINEKLSNFFDIKIIIFVGVCTALYIFYYLLKTNFSYLYILKYFVAIVLIVDYGLRYQVLLEDAEIHNIGVISQECKDLNWFQYLFLKRDDTCKKKVVSPLDVALLQLQQIIIMPLSAFGSGTGNFVKELWGQLPFPWNILMFPFILIICAILVPIIMTVVNGQSFKINIMHIFHLQFGMQDGNIPRPVSEQTMKELLSAVNQNPPKNKSREIFNYKPNKKNKMKKGEKWTSNSAKYFKALHFE